MGLGQLQFMDIGGAVEVGTVELSLPAIVLLFFEVVVPYGSGGLQTSLQVVTVIRLLTYHIRISTFPFSFDSFSLRFAVY